MWAWIARKFASGATTVIGFDDEGRKQYLRWGKQFRELPEFFIDPIKKFGGKLSPVIQQAFVQVTGVSAGGFATPLRREMEAGKSFLETLPARGKELLKAPVPFAIQSVVRSRQILSFAMPISKGLGKWQGRQYFQKAIRSENLAEVQRIYRALLENNLDAESTFKQARAGIKRERTIDNKQQAEKLIQELRSLGKERGFEALQKMRENGTLTPEIEEQVIKILKGEGKVIQQREQLGI